MIGCLVLILIVVGFDCLLFPRRITFCVLCFKYTMIS